MFPLNYCASHDNSTDRQAAKFALSSLSIISGVIMPTPETALCHIELFQEWAHFEYCKTCDTTVVHSMS